MELDTFLAFCNISVAYNEEAKKAYHKGAAHWLRQLAKALGYEKKDFDLRHNRAGIAVSGEITLHSETLYIQFAQSCLGPDYGFMWRTVKDRKDYTGGPNQWAKWEELNDLPKLARKMLDAVAKRKGNS